jgi:hypothetical protein
MYSLLIAFVFDGWLNITAKMEDARKDHINLAGKIIAMRPFKYKKCVRLA